MEWKICRRNENRTAGYALPDSVSDRRGYARGDVLPAANRAVIDSLDYFIVENVRSARRFLSKAGFGRPIDSLEFRELNEHTTDARAVDEMVRPILAGRSAGVISEAGVPGVADPGPWRWPGATGSESAWCL